MGHWNPYTKWWLLWGVMFAIIETKAIWQRQRTPGGTLSSLVWRFIDPSHPLFRVLGIVAIVLLMSHFIFKWPDI